MPDHDEDPDDLYGRKLPHDGVTVGEFRADCARRALLLIRERQALHAAMAGSPRPGDLDRYGQLADAAHDAFGIVAAIEWTRRDAGADSAHGLAAALQDIAINGDPWDKTLLAVPDVIDLVHAHTRPPPA